MRRISFELLQLAPRKLGASLLLCIRPLTLDQIFQNPETLKSDEKLPAWNVRRSVACDHYLHGPKEIFLAYRATKICCDIAGA